MLHRLLSTPFLLLFLLWTILSSSALAQQQGFIRGHVLDADDHPLIGATVIARTGTVERGAVTRSDGSFLLANLAPGKYQIEARMIGYKTVEKDVQVVDGKESRVRMVLTEISIKGSEVVVSATRSQESISQIAGSVTIIDREAIDQQSAVSSDLSEIIAQLAPGMATSNESASSHGQTLRGRGLSVLVDGVPQTTPLRDASRYLRIIDPSAIERIEVIRGATATYGSGATGGIINIITRRPSTDTLRGTSELSSRLSTTHPSSSLGSRFSTQMFGRTSGVDVTLSGSIERTSDLFDADGDLLPSDPHGQGGLSSTTVYNAFVKLGVPIDDNQRVQVSGNYFHALQDTRTVSKAGVVGEVKSPAGGPDTLGLPPGTRNLTASVDYIHKNVLGGALSAQVFYQDYNTRFNYYDGFPNSGSQSYISSEKMGLRINLESTVAMLGNSSVIWGVDLLRDKTAQPLEDGRLWVPPLDQISFAPFVQMKVPVGDLFLLRGGIRHERVALDVPDFHTLYDTALVAGGTLNYDETLFNAGIVTFVTDGVEVFGTFSQGFSVQDVGRVLRNTTLSSVESIHPEPQLVHNAEAGVRASWSVVQVSLSGFRNWSELGSTFDTKTPVYSIIRAPEWVHGIEATADVKPIDALTTGATFTWMEGKQDLKLDGSYDTYLPGYRIPPIKVTGYVEHQMLPTWRNRLQVLHSGSRNQFPGSKNYGEGAVEDYTLLSLTSSVDLWRGRLTVTIDNILNSLYFPAASYWYNREDSFVAGQGRTLSVGYSLNW